MNLNDKKTGFFLENSFPEYFRSFCNGELSVDIGKCGGINTLSLIDVRQEDSQKFPDRIPTVIFSRNLNFLGRPMFGSAIKFISQPKNGTIYTHYPQRCSIYPSGFCSSQSEYSLKSNYDLYLGQNQLSARICASGHDFHLFFIAISKLHLNSGKMTSLKNQMLDNEFGVEHIDANLLPESYRKKQPFRDNGQELFWDKIFFSETENSLIFQGRLKFDCIEKTFIMRMSASEKLTFSENNNQWILSAEWPKDSEIKFVMNFGSSLEETLHVNQKLQADFKSQMQNLIDRTANYEAQSPEIKVSDLPECSDFFRTVSEYQHALLIDIDKDNAAIRASGSKYGYFSLWDHIYPIRDFIVNHDYNEAEKLLRFIVNYPYIETMVFSTSQIILEINEFTAFTQCSDFLDESWEKLKKFFDFSLNYLNKTSGLIGASHCCGVDNPAEVGLDKFFYASCVNGFYYDACRVFENFALYFNDLTYAEKARQVSEKLAKSYLEYFYDEKIGYLRVAVNRNLTRPKLEVFHNSSTIGLDYPYGHYLLRRQIKNIAAYKAKKLKHLFGYTAVSFDSDSPCEMWKAVYMNQHLGHESAVARLADNANESYRLLNKYLKKFSIYKNAIETFNYDGCPGNEVQNADWQAFSATGALHGIYQGLAGLNWHRGGLNYLISEDNHDIEINNFNFRNSVWNIKMKGAGKYPKIFKINDYAIHGSMQIPADLPRTPKISWEIERSDTPFDRPTLLQAEDVEIISLSSSENSLNFKVKNCIHGALWFYAPQRPALEINGAPADFEYDESTKHGWIDRKFNPEDSVCCSININK